VKIMFASLGAYGHLYPMMPLALASAAAGHETVVAVGPPFLGRLLPQGADQFFNAQILTEVGAARTLTNDAQQPGTITEAVQALLGESPEREAATRVRDEIAAMPSPAEVILALVELAGL
jgi:UDP:flavonoid glycosyltransferase YjiC (YdhE family)